jgi:hypothetical protein
MGFDESVPSGFSRKAVAAGKFETLHASFRLKPEATLDVATLDVATLDVPRLMSPRFMSSMDRQLPW